MGWKPKSPTSVAAVAKTAVKAKAKMGRPATVSGFSGRQLASETGFSQPYISMLLKKGVSVAAIRAKAAEKKAKAANVGPKSTGHAVGHRASLVPQTRAPKSAPGVTQLAGEGQSETQAQADLRKAIAIADKHEMDLLIRRGELVPLVDVMNYGAGGIVACKDILLKLDELGDRLAQESDPAKCRAMIKLDVSRALAEIEGAWQKLAEMSVDHPVVVRADVVNPNDQQETDEGEEED